MEDKKMTDAEKLEMILNKYQLTYTAFARKIDISKDTLYSLKLGKAKNFTSDLMRKILNTFPDISAVWLLTGKGEMMEIDNDGVSIRQRNFNINNVKHNDLTNEIEMFRDIIKEKDSQIKNLLDQIASLISILNTKKDKECA